MGNWTNGPWTVVGDYRPEILSAYGRICFMNIGPIYGENHKNNAQLISAAPDMAEAIDGSLQCLRLISNMLERDGGVRSEVKQELDEHIGNMMDALRKAKGE